MSRLSRCIAILGCVLVIFLSALNAHAAPVNLSLQTGEIRFDGAVIGIDAAKNSLIISVESFTLPNGRSSKLSASKPKTLILQNDTVIVDANGKPISLEQIQVDHKIAAIGRDAGSGKDTEVRVLIVSGGPVAEGEAGTPGAAQADENGAPIVRTGETRYDGKITGVLSANTFTISVLSTANAQGEMQELMRPQPKTIQISDSTILRSLQDEARLLKISDLKIGLRVALVGKDANSKTVNAREVAVWDDDAGNSRSLGIVTVNARTADLLTKGDEAVSARSFEQAMKAYNDALRAAMDSNDSPGQAMSHDRLALLFEDIGQPKRALESYQKALAIWQRIGDADSEATTQLNLSSYYHRQDDLKNARQAIENSVRLFAATNRRGLAIAYSSLGRIQADQDELENAVASWQQALNLARQTQEHDEEATVLGRLAIAYAKLKQSEKSLEVTEQLVALLPQIADKSDRANATFRAGLGYQIVGQKEKARSLLTEAKKLWEENGQRDNAAIAQKQLDGLDGKADEEDAPEPDAAIIPR